MNVAFFFFLHELFISFFIKRRVCERELTFQQPRTIRWFQGVLVVVLVNVWESAFTRSSASSSI